MAETAQHENVFQATGAAARIARVYAEALMAEANKAGRADAVGDELSALARSVTGGSPAVAEFLASNAVGRKAKAPPIAAALKAAEASELLWKFFGVLNQNNRLGLLRAIAAAYQAMRDEAAGRVRVKVTSAVPLSDAQVAELTQTLSVTLKASPVLDTRTDPELLGGLVVQVGDRVYDTSVRTRLDNLRTHLMASGTHGA